MCLAGQEKVIMDAADFLVLVLGIILIVSACQRRIPTEFRVLILISSFCGLTGFILRKVLKVWMLPMNLFSTDLLNGVLFLSLSLSMAGAFFFVLSLFSASIGGILFKFKVPKAGSEGSDRVHG